MNRIINFNFLIILLFLSLIANGTALAEKAEEKPSDKQKRGSVQMQSIRYV